VGKRIEADIYIEKTGELADKGCYIFDIYIEKKDIYIERAYVK
jgi:hypothetical protein